MTANAPRDTDDTMPVLERSISIASSRSNIRSVEDFLLRIHDVMEFKPSVLDRIMISVTEAVNNGIIHGNKTDPDKLVHLSCTCTLNHARFEIRDEGNGFSPEDVPDPLAEQNLLKEGGRGLLIIRAMMDSVAFRKNEKGMTLILDIDLKGEVN